MITFTGECTVGCIGSASINIDVGREIVYTDSVFPDGLHLARPEDSFLSIDTNSIINLQDNQQEFIVRLDRTWKFEAETDPFPGCTEQCVHIALGVDAHTVPESSTLALLTLALLTMFLWGRVSRP